MLDGPLAMLRNVHKVDPLVRLPMALGFAHVGMRARPVRPARFRGLVAAGALAVTAGALVVLLVASAQPAFTGDLRKEGWRQIPQAWVRGGRLARRSRGRAPHPGPPGLRLRPAALGLDDRRADPGRGQDVRGSRAARCRLVPGADHPLPRRPRGTDPGRARQPARSPTPSRGPGIGYVVVRRDLDLFASGAPSPARVDQALARDRRGSSPVARFGSTGFGSQAALVVYTVDRDVPCGRGRRPRRRGDHERRAGGRHHRARVRASRRRRPGGHRHRRDPGPGASGDRRSTATASASDSSAGSSTR